MQKPPGLHGCLRCIHPTPLPPCFTWGQMASVLRLSSLLWLPVNLLPYKHSPPSPVCPFHLILASASRRIRFICGLNEAHSLGLRHRPTPHPHPMDPSQNTEDTSQDKQPQQVTHFKKLFIEFNFQKHRHLRQFCKDPEFLQGCFGYSKKKKKREKEKTNHTRTHTRLTLLTLKSPQGRTVLKGTGRRRGGACLLQAASSARALSKGSTDQ